MRAMYTELTLLLSLLKLLLMLLSLGTHLSEVAAAAASVVGSTAADKEVAPVGVVKTDLLSLEQEIGGNPAEVEQHQGVRHARYFLFGIGAGPAIYGSGYGWGYPGYGYTGSPYYGYGGYGGYGGYYPSVFGYKKIIIG